LGIVGKVILSLLVLFETSLITSNQFSICEPKSLNYFYSNLLNCKKTNWNNFMYNKTSHLFFYVFLTFSSCHKNAISTKQLMVRKREREKHPNQFQNILNFFFFKLYNRKRNDRIPSNTCYTLWRAISLKYYFNFFLRKENQLIF
jgi:hypothetical protein